MSQYCRALCMLIILMLFPQVAAAQPSRSAEAVFQDGQRARQAGNFEQAAQLFQQACDGGAYHACNNLAVLYGEGRGVNKDASRAAELYRLACGQGVSFGCFGLGMYHWEGKGVRQEFSQSVQYLTRACDLNHDIACNNLGILFSEGKGTRRDAKKAAALYRKSCDLLSKMGCNNYASALLSGAGVERDVLLASSIAGFHCSTGHKPSCETSKLAMGLIRPKANSGYPAAATPDLGPVRHVAFKDPALGKSEDCRGIDHNFARVWISCWLQRIVIRGISETAALSFGQGFEPITSFSGNTDVYGIPETAWQTGADPQILSFVLRADRLNTVAKQFEVADPKALYLASLLSEFSVAHINGGSDFRAGLSEAFILAYPACKNAEADPGLMSRCKRMQNAIQSHLIASGYDRPVGDGWGWMSFRSVMSSSDLVLRFPRLGWVAFADGSSVQNEKQGRGYIEAWKAGVPDARRTAYKALDSCYGDRELVAAFHSAGISLVRVHEEAIKLGVVDAALRLAKRTEEGGCGYPIDPQFSFRVMLQAAEMGSVEAMQKTVDSYSRGKGTKVDYTEALYWQRRIEKLDPSQSDPKKVTSLVEWAEAEAAALRRDGTVSTSGVGPINNATVRAVILRELKFATDFGTAGAMPIAAAFGGGLYDWNEERGSVRIRHGSPMSLGFNFFQSYQVEDTKCRPSKGAPGFTCNYRFSMYLDFQVGPMSIANEVQFPLSDAQDTFVFDGERWRSPTMAAKMLGGLPAKGSEAGTGAGRSSLCRSLGAGVLAAGGTSTSRPLSPDAWGC